jgi:putative hydrolase of the HAD superfamily
MKKRVLKAVFFDIDDTLYSSSEFAAMARLNAVKAMIKAGLRMELKECLVIVNKIVARKHSNYNHLFDDLLKTAGKGAYPDSNPSILIAAGVVAYHQTKNTWLKPYPDVMEVLKILKQSTPLTLGVISSGFTIKQAEKLYRCGLTRYLDPKAIFFSQSLGVDKPHKYFFAIPCRSIGVRPQEAMYVGDRPRNDLVPAMALGMVGVLNRRTGKYMDAEGRARPDYMIHDFWELLECITSNFELAPVG